jgi:CheY-like chemotaxis protein
VNHHSPILLVDDDPNDVRLFQEALKVLEAPNPVWAVENGEAAVDYLSGHGIFADRKYYRLPELIVSDLKMPLMDGLELLQWVRNEPRWATLPFLVLSASDQEADVAAAYRCGASSYIRKPGSFAELQSIVRVMLGYWNMCAKPDAALEFA